MTAQNTEDSTTPDIDPTEVIAPVIQTVHPPVVKAMIFSGVVAVITTCLCAAAFFANMTLHVWRNGSWPPNVGVGVVMMVLIGPVLTSWQFMGVRKILTSLLSNENGLGLGGIAKEVIAKRMGFDYNPTPKQTASVPPYQQPINYPEPPPGFAQNVPPVPPDENAR
jgi:hypothetical protein